ncbi:type I pantothenate kinase [Streptococcus pluranimalium]|uniref:type I pantothenate kinase n=1 Tax=Streptococcus hyovaginalis TaxID=149015 RepID=UPI002A7CDBBB|nr:type I pantothenate kinase [Streptococcus hyovaginalis]MDY3025092.1 type I pantothenate kinase [Streptococcus hyovaginalis]MDY4510327.1 type I pantothenate kinase [Streptococcus hyovaginalis]MDY5973306.1 type I pantothenate kinase [Streptococcus hyovaginalis]
MIHDLLNFKRISRSNWQQLHRTKPLLLTLDELESLRSLNDKIDLNDVKDIYLPLINLIKIYKKASDDLSFSKSLFLQDDIYQHPFIIGVSGSVAVGKSTTSRLLQLLLSRSHPDARVELVTTDGFLYPNQQLVEKGILNRKGFPESYDMPKLLNFLDAIKTNGTANIPIYSHEIYDIVPDQLQTIEAPDFLIVEGINVFQNPQNEHLYMTDYFDFSIYIDASVEHIESWYLERFSKLLTIAEKDPNNYYHRFTQLPHNEVLDIARDTWKTINLVNLQDYIEPSRNRADVILHKSANHKIDEIYLKK